MRMPFSIVLGKALVFVITIFLNSKVDVGSTEKNEHLMLPIALQLVLHIMNMVRCLGQMPIQYSVNYGLLICTPRKGVFANAEGGMKKNHCRLHTLILPGQVMKQLRLFIINHHLAHGCTSQDWPVCPEISSPWLLSSCGFPLRMES